MIPLVRMVSPSLWIVLVIYPQKTDLWVGHSQTSKTTQSNLAFKITLNLASSFPMPNTHKSLRVSIIFLKFSLQSKSTRKTRSKRRKVTSLTTFPHEECMESARSSTNKSTALSSGRVEVKLKPKSTRTYKEILMDCKCRFRATLTVESMIKMTGNVQYHPPKEKIRKGNSPAGWYHS